MTITSTTTPERRSLPASKPVEWSRAPGLVPYAAAVSAMEGRVAAIHDGTAREAVWLVEHPPVYTAGTSARPQDLIAPDRFPVHETGRGGQYTYHGPGQRVAYAMLDVKARRSGDVRGFVAGLEAWVIATLSAFGVHAVVREGRVGVWAPRADGRTDDKIAAVGIRLRRWISFHGVAINVAPDLSHFEGIVPCGIADHGVTSLQALGCAVGMDAFDQELRRQFEQTFTATTVDTGQLFCEVPSAGAASASEPS